MVINIAWKLLLNWCFICVYWWLLSSEDSSVYWWLGIDCCSLIEHYTDGICGFQLLVLIQNKGEGEERRNRREKNECGSVVHSNIDIHIFHVSICKRKIYCIFSPKVKVVLKKYGEVIIEMIFDGAHSDKRNWFTRDRLVDWPYETSKTQPATFSLIGWVTNNWHQ